MKFGKAVLLSMLTGAALAAATLAQAETGDIDLITASYASGRAVGGNTAFIPDSLSDDGRFVLFFSNSGELVPNDTNGHEDLFVRDRVAGKTTRVNVSSSGAVANGPLGAASISGDGRYVVFASAATNLVPNDTNGKADIFLRDLQNGTTTRVSLAANGAQANGHSNAPTVSTDGRYVAFTSGSSNLVDHVRAGIFVRDRLTQRTSYVKGSAYGYCTNARISGNGRYVAFECPWHLRQFADEGHGNANIYLEDLDSGAVRVVAATNRQTRLTDISADGRYVAFYSQPGELFQAFLFDRVSMRREVVSLSMKDKPGNLHSYNPTVSNDGRYVVFESWAGNLVADDPNLQEPDIFVRDRQLGTTRRVSVGPPVVRFQPPSLSGDGRVALFSTNGRLTASDTSDDPFDLYTREL